MYWLRLMCESAVVPRERLNPMLRETEEIYAVIAAIIVVAKRKLRPKGVGPSAQDQTVEQS